MPGIDRTKLRALIAKREITPRALSRSVGDNPYLVRDILSGKSNNPRADTLSRIATQLGVPAAELMMTEPFTTNFPSSPVQVPPMFLPVRYRVQAGLWREVENDRDEFLGTHPVAPDPRYAEWPQWLEEVVGDSCDKKIPPGGFAHVVDAIAMGYVARHEDYVIVERRRNGGQLKERTLKQVIITVHGHIELWPRSNNPKWNTPINLSADVHPGEEIEVEIVCLVIGAYLPFS